MGPDQPKNPDLEGEGNKTADQHYRQGATDYAQRKEDVERAAKEAEADVERAAKEAEEAVEAEAQVMGEEDDDIQ
jgi:hypothetical protein